MKRFKKHYSKVLITISIVSFLIAVLFLPFFNKIYPNIYVAGIYVGDKNKSEALNYLQEKYKFQEKLILNINGSKNEILTSEIVEDVDYKSSVERAYNFAKSGNLFKDFITRFNLIFKTTNLSPIVRVNESKLLETLLILSNSAGTKPVTPSVKKVGTGVVVNPGKDGVEIDMNKARLDIGNWLSFGKTEDILIELKEVKVALNQAEIKNYEFNAEKLVNKKIELKLDYESFVINDEDLISFLTPTGFSDDLIKIKILEISRKLNRSPQDSVFIVENEKVKEFTSSKDGITVDENLLLKLIKEMQPEINIPVAKISPKIKNEDVNNLGIKTLLGKGFSNFRGSIPNRIYNVNLAQSKFKGVLVPPNETVSFNEILGDVSAFTGYKSAYVIMDGKTVLGDGGGVCQVSTTLFRAVLSAGLPIVERRAHAYRVGYYEQGFGPGLDATVYSPTTDFKFKNDTEAYLLIQPTINLDNLSLEFEIYGTSDGRVATTSKPIITSSSAPAEDLYQDDPTMPAGHVKQIEHRAYGAKVVFDYKVTRNGEELINQKFVSNYRPWRAVYLRGTAL